MSIETYRANGGSSLNYLHPLSTGIKYAYKHRARIMDEGKKFGKTAKRKYNELKERMAPIPKHNKKRKLTVKYSSVRNEAGKSTRAPGVKYGKKKKGVIPKKQKSVKVSKHLREAINKINEAAKVHGSYRATGFGGMYQGLTNVQQVVSGLGNYSNLTNAVSLQNPFYFQWAFQPEDWLHMLSVLFNGKPDSAGLARVWSTVGSLGCNFNVVNGGSGPGDIGNGNVPHPSGVPMSVNGSGLQFHVKKCWEKYVLRNVSQRTWTIDIYECAPKMVGVEQAIGTVDSGGVGPFAPLPRVSYPEIQWGQGLLDEQRNGVRVDGATPNLLYTRPTDVRFFNQMYKVEMVTIVLEPGQNYEYILRGPSDVNVDLAKLFRPTGNVQDELFNIQKYSRIPMFVSHCDMELQNTGAGGLAGATAGRYSAVAANFVGSIAIERTQYASFDMPEQVGMQISSNAAGLGTTVTSLQNNLRRPAKYEVVYTQSGVGSAYRFDEENPVNAENV